MRGDRRLVRLALIVLAVGLTSPEVARADVRQAAAIGGGPCAVEK